MQIKRSTLVFAAFGIGPLVLVAGCDGSTGDGARATLSPIQSSSYVTIEPATTTTTTTIDPATAGAGQVSSDAQTYVVQRNDSVSKIASLHNITVDALVNYNDWANSGVLIMPGDEVLIPPDSVIPGTATEASSADSESDSTATAESAESAEPATTDDSPACQHTIAADENPTQVAGKYGLNFDQLQLANPSKDFTTTFGIGDVIDIPAEGNC